MIAALFVEKNGVYAIPGIDLWDASRDARNYAGPFPVIAHPPCERWGRYWSGGPSVKIKRFAGDDGGCFSHAIWSVRTFGGVLEHPEASKAWDWFGLRRPPREGGWIEADKFGGFTCCVEQGHYGHRARKATWLYAVRPNLGIQIEWGKAEGKIRLDQGFHTKEERARGGIRHSRISKMECIATPPHFVIF